MAAADRVHQRGRKSTQCQGGRFVWPIPRRSARQFPLPACDKVSGHWQRKVPYQPEAPPFAGRRRSGTSVVVCAKPGCCTRYAKRMKARIDPRFWRSVWMLPRCSNARFGFRRCRVWEWHRLRLCAGSPYKLWTQASAPPRHRPRRDAFKDFRASEQRNAAVDPRTKRVVGLKSC